MSLMDWWLDCVSGGEHSRQIEREKQRERKRAEQHARWERERQKRSQRLREHFIESCPAIITDPIEIPASSVHCPVSTSSSGDSSHDSGSGACHSCSSHSSCGGSSSCGGGGGD